MRNIIKIVVILFFIFGCLFTSEVYACFGREKIIEYKYNENVRGYNLSFKKNKKLSGLILREEDGKKVITEERAKELVDKFNQKKFPLDNYVEKDINGISETAKYEASKKYYEGMKLQKELEFAEAINSYEKAHKTNKYLKYQSDIYFRLGQCYQSLEKIDKAVEAYETFLLYSERVIPFSFYQNKNLEDSLKDLFKKAEENIVLLKEDEDVRREEIDIFPHTGREIPSIYRYGLNPGFTLGKQKPGLLGISFGYSSIDGAMGSLEIRKGLTDSMDIGLGGYLFGDQKTYVVSTPLSIYRATDNRFGVKIVPRFSIHNFTDIDFNANVLGANISSAYFITPQISVFCGVSTPLYYSDNNNQYELVSYWRDTYAYGGISFQGILGEMGFSVFSYNNDFYIEMLGPKGIRIIGKNLSNNEFYVAIASPLLF